MTLPTLPDKKQIEAAIAATKKTHAYFGYARPLNDSYAEAIVWAAIFAVMLNAPETAESR